MRFDHSAEIGLIWAQTVDGVIGYQGGMPWHAPEDLKHFKELTLGHPVIMGRRTWESFPEKFRPLPGRFNIVVSASWAQDPSLTMPNFSALVPNVAEGLSLAADLVKPDNPQIWVIGGASLYQAMIEKADRIERTVLQSADGAEAPIPGDTFAPDIDGARWELTAADPGPDTWHISTADQLRYRFESFRRIQAEMRSPDDR